MGGEGRGCLNEWNTRKEQKAPPARRTLPKANWNWVPALPLCHCVTVSPSQTLRALPFSQLRNGHYKVRCSQRSQCVGKKCGPGRTGHTGLGPRKVSRSRGKAEAPPQKPRLSRSPSYPQDSPECLWLFGVLGVSKILSLLCLRAGERVSVCLGRLRATKEANVPCPPEGSPALQKLGLALGHCPEQPACTGPGDTAVTRCGGWLVPRRDRGPGRKGDSNHRRQLGEKFPCESEKGTYSAGPRRRRHLHGTNAGRFQTSTRKKFLTVLGPKRGRRWRAPHRPRRAGKGIITLEPRIR